MPNGGSTDTLVAAIEEAIAAEIVSGELIPGSDLNTVDLARRFATSRTPVREALLHLAKAGLVDITTGKRPRVSRMTASDIVDLYEVRRQLMARAVQLLIERGDPEDLTALRGLLDELIEAIRADDAGTSLDVVMRGMNFIADSCGNRLLAGMLASLRHRIARMINFASGRVPAERSIFQDNVRCYRAILDGDTVVATALVSSTLERTMRTVVGVLTDDQARDEALPTRRPRRRQPISRSA